MGAEAGAGLRRAGRAARHRPRGARGRAGRRPRDDVLVVGGDFDPVDRRRPEASARARTGGPRGAAAILATELDEPGGYARVVHERGRLVAIVEGTDAPAGAPREQAGLAARSCAFRRTDLFRALPAVGRENRQSEYYLNEVLPILIDKGERVSVVPVDTGGTFGVNSRGGLAAVERVVRDRINAAHMDNGVTIVDPDATYIDVDVRIGRDTVIRPMTFLEGETRIGAGRVDRTVDADRRLARRRPERGDVRGGPGLDDRQGRPRSGRSSRMRPGTVLEDGSKAGAFVDLKNVDGGQGLEGAAPVLRGRRDDRRRT